MYLKVYKSWQCI